MFELKITAKPDDIDALGHVNNAVYIRWVQEVATAHWLSAAGPHDIEACLWVVTRHEIDYLRAVAAGETVTARTWVADAPKGARFERHVEFVGSDGKPRARAKTVWAMIDSASGKPMRVPPELAARFVTPRRSP